MEGLGVPDPGGRCVLRVSHGRCWHRSEGSQEPSAVSGRAGQHGAGAGACNGEPELVKEGEPSRCLGCQSSGEGKQVCMGWAGHKAGGIGGQSH